MSRDKLTKNSHIHMVLSELIRQEEDGLRGSADKKPVELGSRGEWLEVAVRAGSELDGQGLQKREIMR